ncbi:MAG TPA: 3'-5' exonuclease, partial [Kofleriaceae bacterium]|nr:3'-5' exonuclease [Kofleriaceae bacterium]
MESLPLFPGLFDAPAPASASGAAPGAAEASGRRARRGKGRTEATVATEATLAAVAVVESLLPAAEGSGPVAVEPGAAAVEAAAEVAAEVLQLVAECPPPPVASPRRSDARLLIFDVETTGKDRKRDQVIELCMQRGLSGTDYKIWRFKPTVPIHPKAQKVHGISMEELAGCPGFERCIDEIAAWFAAAEVIVGYNLAFDVGMLQAEWRRAGRGTLDLVGKKVVDPFRLWQQREPRRLLNAHERFVGETFEDAHSAVADVAATGRVLEGMLTAFGLDEHGWDELERICNPARARWIGPSEHVQWDEDSGVAVLAFGKNEGMPLAELAASDDASYLRWVCNRDSDFPAHVVELCSRALELAREPETFAAWVRDRFGAPP